MQVVAPAEVMSSKNNAQHVQRKPNRLCYPEWTRGMQSTVARSGQRVVDNISIEAKDPLSLFHTLSSPALARPLRRKKSITRFAAPEDPA